MSSRPNPVALTAAMLMRASAITAANCWRHTGLTMREQLTNTHAVAQLASAIHRLAPACKRLALAECNGEWRDGQRRQAETDRLGNTLAWPPADQGKRLAALDKSITDYATRLDRRIVKLNAQLAPFGYQLIRQGDPRGATLVMAETPVDDSATHYAIG